MKSERNNDTIVIREAVEEDFARITEIYSYYVRETTITFEYIPPTIEEMIERFQGIRMRFPYLVVEENKKVVGYAYASVFKARAAYDWCAETTIYLDVEMKAKGIGSLLYGELIQRLKAQNITNLNACITLGNPQSIAFHEKIGYEKVAHFHNCGYKFEQWHDIIWMEAIIGEHKVKMEPFIPYFQLKEKNN